MTKISLVRGINRSIHRPAFIPKAENMRSIPERRYLNYAGWTEGELLLMLGLEQIEMEQSYYADPLNIYGQARDMLIDTIYRGAHTGIGVGMPTGFVPEEIANTVRLIRHAKKLTGPAGIAMDQIARPAINGGFDPNAPLIEEYDCRERYPYPTGVSRPTIPSVFEAIDKKREECWEQNRHIRLLNEYYGESAHQNLYVFMTDEELNNAPNLVAGKGRDHRKFHNMMNDITKLSVSALRMWTRNGVLRENYKKGGQPLQPEEAIQILKANANGVGLGPLAIIAIVKTALAVMVQLIAVMSQRNQQRMRDNVPDIGLPGYGPADGDWRFGPLPGGGGSNPTTGGQSPIGENGPGGNTPGGNNSNSKGSAIAVGVGITAAGLLLLNSNSNEKKKAKKN